jgi:hypothetical protein
MMRTHCPGRRSDRDGVAAEGGGGVEHSACIPRSAICVHSNVGLLSRRDYTRTNAHRVSTFNHGWQ